MGTYTVELKQDSRQVRTQLETLLTEAHLQFAVSFDLKSARENAQCDCPYHGTAKCTCQYEILVVSDPRQYPGETRTITIHGRDGVTWVSLIALPFTRSAIKSDRLGKRLRRLIFKNVVVVKNLH